MSWILDFQVASGLRGFRGLTQAYGELSSCPDTSSEREAIGKLPCIKIQFGRTWRNIEIWLERTLIRLGTEDGTRESYDFS